MHFASPYYLWLLTLLVPMIGYYVWRTLQGGAAIRISSVAGVVRAPRTPDRSSPTATATASAWWRSPAKLSRKAP